MLKSRRKFIGSALTITSGLVLADAFWLENRFLEHNEFCFGNASKEIRNITLVQISDLHLQSIDTALVQLAGFLNQLQPALILITGDAVDKAQNTLLLHDFLALIDKNIKKSAIVGNWEYWAKIDFEQLNDIYRAHNCDLLINQTKQYSFLNKTLSITGIDDYIGGNADFHAAIKNLKLSDYHIILNHCPQYSDYITQESTAPIDFILSGHTHGGQVTVFGYAPFLPPGSGKYVKGWYEQNACKMYVSKGIGTSLIPARFGARAEIAIFHLPA